MSSALDTQTIEDLWQRFKLGSRAGSDEITLDGLRAVMRALGHAPTDEELRHILLAADASASISFDKFAALVAALQGDTESRLALAFEVFDANRDGVVTPDEMRAILAPFGLSEDELEQMFREADRDGDGALDLDDFRWLMPPEHEQVANRYQDSHPLFAGTLRRQVQARVASRVVSPTARADTGAPATAPADLYDQARGTSRLQMQIGLFRILQGAAYRSFRESYCANYETHLRAKKLPYTISHFVAFVGRTIALYKALGVVEPACFPVLDALTASIEAGYARLQERIAQWPARPKTPAMLKAAAAMQAEQSQSAALRQKFAAGIELALTLRKKDLGLADLVEDLLARHELNRLRRLELHEEMAPPAADDDADPERDLASWNRVLLQSADEDIPGAMMPAAYWYEDFMPKLLAACSVAVADDVASNTVPDEAALDAWFATTREAGEFDHYGKDVADHFMRCAPQQKLAIRRAWRLTRHYLNGVQKRREREEFGRESGFVSQYVAFLDVYLGRADVRNAQMRLSFPYYIGPVVWRFLHTSAEIVCSRRAKEQKRLVEAFKDFFRLFATMYACPYCRYHLNAYVLHNREVEMYPMEYLRH